MDIEEGTISTWPLLRIEPWCFCLSTESRRVECRRAQRDAKLRRHTLELYGECKRSALRGIERPPESFPFLPEGFEHRTVRYTAGESHRCNAWQRTSQVYSLVLPSVQSLHLASHLERSSRREDPRWQYFSRHSTSFHERPLATRRRHRSNRARRDRLCISCPLSNRADTSPTVRSKAHHHVLVFQETWLDRSQRCVWNRNPMAEVEDERERASICNGTHRVECV